MRLIMLGTGNAMVTECYNTCFVLSEGNQHFLVDAGGGNRIFKVLKDTGVDVKDIHDMFITHAHPDHMLGAIWILRIIGTKMNQGIYEGEFRVYCHEELRTTMETIARLTLQKKVCKHIGERIVFVPLDHGDKKEILGCETTFFDIYSTKLKQYGFTMNIQDRVKFTCVGDEPYNEKDYEYVKGSDWLTHEAFCLYSEADRFKPYEKHHSTVKEACQTAELLRIPNLILYHTEEVNLKNRKELYLAEGREYYTGSLYVPDDMEIFEI